MANQIKLRNHAADEWLANDPVLLLGEVGLETDTRTFKIGDGTSLWSELLYAGGSGGASSWDDLEDVPTEFPPSSHVHDNAIAAGAAGFMTGADKTKLDGIEAGAQVNVSSDITSGPVTSSGGVSAIADAALSIAKTSGLQSSLDLKAALISPVFTTPDLGAATATSINATSGFQVSASGVASLLANDGLQVTGTTFNSTFLAFPSSPASNYTVNMPAASGTLALTSGNVATATSLATSRTIDGQSFDGTANVTVIAPGTNAATSKTTPVDADEIPLVDSAASNVLKKLTWANLKATIKTYFDTLYMSITGFSGVMVTKADGSRTPYPFATPVTDTTRGLALEAAFAAAVAGDTIDLSPGNYYVAKATSTISGIVAQYAILDKMTIRLNGAYLWKQNTDTASCMFTPSATSGVNDWSIIGPGTIEGSYLDTANTTAARGSAAAEMAVNIPACRRWRISDITVKNMAGTGIQFNNATQPSDSYGTGNKMATGHISNCNIDLNNLGVGLYAGNEYIIFTNCTFNKNLTALDIYSANHKFIGCESSLNTNYALRIRHAVAANEGHGCWTGGSITHNPGFAIAVESGMDQGFLFTGVTFGADSTSTNKIQSLGGGLTFVGCYVESPFYASSTPTGINVMKNCFIAGTYTVITDMSAAERAKWKFMDNHTLTGRWAQDDNLSGNATLVGGTVAVALPQITSTSTISLTRKTSGGTLGAGGLSYALNAGTGFTISAIDLAGVLSSLETSVVTWDVSEA